MFHKKTVRGMLAAASGSWELAPREFADRQFVGYNYPSQVSNVSRIVHVCYSAVTKLTVGIHGVMSHTHVGIYIR